jgi:hypothetical protein
MCIHSTYRVSKFIDFMNNRRGISSNRFLCSRLKTAYQTSAMNLFYFASRNILTVV